MTLYTYTGYLRDITQSEIGDYFPVLQIRPEREGLQPSGGVVSKVPVQVEIKAGGFFSVDLIPSGELGGIDYILTVGRFEDTLDGHVFYGHDLWRFTAVAGGGSIGEMAGGSLLAVWIGPPWPDAPLPSGLYIDRTDDNEYGIVGI